MKLSPTQARVVEFLKIARTMRNPSDTFYTSPEGHRIHIATSTLASLISRGDVRVRHSEGHPPRWVLNPDRYPPQGDEHCWVFLPAIQRTPGGMEPKDIARWLDMDLPDDPAVSRAIEHMTQKNPYRFKINVIRASAWKKTDWTRLVEIVVYIGDGEHRMAGSVSMVQDLVRLTCRNFETSPDDNTMEGTRRWLELVGWETRADKVGNPWRVIVDDPEAERQALQADAESASREELEAAGAVMDKLSNRPTRHCLHEVRLVDGRKAEHDIDGLEPFGEDYWTNHNGEHVGHTRCGGSGAEVDVAAELHNLAVPAPSPEYVVRLILGQRRQCYLSTFDRNRKPFFTDDLASALRTSQTTARLNRIRAEAGFEASEDARFDVVSCLDLMAFELSIGPATVKMLADLKCGNIRSVTRLEASVVLADRPDERRMLLHELRMALGQIDLALKGEWPVRPAPVPQTMTTPELASAQGSGEDGFGTLMVSRRKGLIAVSSPGGSFKEFLEKSLELVRQKEEEDHWMIHGWRWTETREAEWPRFAENSSGYDYSRFDDQRLEARSPDGQLFAIWPDTGRKWSLCGGDMGVLQIGWHASMEEAARKAMETATAFPRAKSSHPPVQVGSYFYRRTRTDRWELREIVAGLDRGRPILTSLKPGTNVGELVDSLAGEWRPAEPPTEAPERPAVQQHENGLFHCDDCDPSFGCWKEENPCVKQPTGPASLRSELIELVQRFGGAAPVVAAVLEEERKARRPILLEEYGSAAAVDMARAVWILLERAGHVFGWMPKETGNQE